MKRRARPKARTIYLETDGWSISFYRTPRGKRRTARDHFGYTVACQDAVERVLRRRLRADEAYKLTYTLEVV